MQWQYGIWSKSFRQEYYFSPKNKDKIDEVNIRLGRNEFMPFAPVLIEKNAKKTL